MTAETIIEKLNLTRHPEGGFYRETYRGEKSITLDNGKVRNTGTAVYYLLKDTDKSHFHKVSSDELWLFHQGEPLEIFMITNDGKLETKTLGNRLDLNEEPQVIITANVWFAARLKNEKGFALVSCIVAPGFDFDDYELGNKNELIKAFPNIKTEIEKLSL
ncbi:MAG: cupin domain-containing protein [Chitinophagaceae bacterium]|nr:cupin domain-containing protein [Chitinophagaceae bacterium]MCW5929717.1 cupin domain-containing protein [Chitinophagaceae bacterium]